MNRVKYLFLCFICVMATAVTACGSSDAEATPTPEVLATEAIAENTPSATPTLAEVTYGTAVVDSVQILREETFPVQINVRVRGEFPDTCTRIHQVLTERNETVFTTNLTTAHEPTAACTTTPTPFEEVLSLQVFGLDAGTYTISVNGVNGSFTFDVPNRPLTAEEMITPTVVTATAVAAADTATISGLVWHDLCATLEVSNTTVVSPTITATPAPGCVANAEGALQADGKLTTDEPPLAGVTVSLAEGSCTAPVAEQTAVTDDNGNYAFIDLPAGDYCVFVDPLATANALLLPGGWTFPTAQGSEVVTVASGEIKSDVNFGWDYQFLPVPEVDTATCINSIEFVEDLNIPDDTVFPPGQEFTKSWRLRNNGTCPWTTAYTLVNVDDAPAIPSEPISLTTVVAPGQTVDVSATLNAPETPGTYRLNWQLANANGQRFGINGFLSDAFWFQIVVEEGAVVTTPVPNSASITGVVWDDFSTDGTQGRTEGGLEGVEVILSRGACPTEAVSNASILANRLTDGDGRYLFENLPKGTYCISIDAFSPNNVELLIPGDWTYPAQGTGRLGIILTEGETRENVDFGWDFQ